MRNQALHISPPLTTWVVVADAKQAQIYVCNKTTHHVPLDGTNTHHLTNDHPNHDLTPVLNGHIIAESLNDYQIGHDRRGTTSSSNSSAHNTYEPHGTLSDELVRRYVKDITQKLSVAHNEKLFDQIVLVAPAKILSNLREHLSADIKHHIVGQLAKELSHLHGKDLVARLRETLNAAYA